MSDVYTQLMNVEYLVDNLTRSKNCVEGFDKIPELSLLATKVNDALVHAEHAKAKLTERRDAELYPD